MRKLSTNAFLVFSGDAVARALGFLAAAHLARALDRESFGVTVIGFAFLSYVLWFADLGLGTLGTREMGKGQGKGRYEMGDILSARLLLAAAVALPAFALVMILYPEEPLRTVVASYLLALVPYSILLEWYYQGIQRFTPLIISRSLIAGLYFITLYLLIAHPSDLPLVPYIFVASNLIPALLLFAFKRRGDSIAPRELSLRRTIGVIRHASTIGVGGIFAQTVQLLPPLVLGYYSTADAGMLGAAMRIIAVVLIIDRVFATLFLPAIARLWSEGAERVAGHLERVTGIVIVAGFSIATLITIYARSIMALVFGASYEDGGEVLSITAWFAAATLINSVFSFGLIGAGKERAYLRATVLSGIVTALLTVVMIALWGLIGAAIAMVASEICVVALTYREFRRHVAVRFIRPLAISSVVALLLVYGATFIPIAQPSLDALWQGPLVLLLFLALAALLGGVRKDDLVWLKER